MIKVLYTDDEPSLLEIGKVFLEESGEMQVETAVSAQDAIQVLHDRAFDVVVSDYQMPGMDGIEFLKYLRGKYPALPFILFTGRGREEIVIAAINNGADFYLQKGGDPVAQFAELGHKIKQSVQRNRNDQKIVHFNRLYAVLSGVNTTIVRALSKKELFSEVCRISVEEGKFTMAWIGLVDTTRRILVPAAYYGFEEGYLKDVRISIDDNPLGQGPSGRAVRERSHVIYNAITREPRMAPWLDEINKRGYHSTGAFPFYLHNTLAGVFQLYSVEENFFSESEIHLLDEVASDISFALERIEAEESRVRTENSLKENEEKLAAIVSGSPVPKFVIDQNHRIMYWNRALEQVSGISASEVIGTCDQWRAFYDHERPTMADLVLDGAFFKIQEFYEGKASESPLVAGAFEATDFFPHMGEKGTYLRFMAAPIKNNLGVTIGVVETLIDVSDFKRAESELVIKNDEVQAAFEEITATEEELRANLDELILQEQELLESREKYRSLFTDSRDGIVMVDEQGRFLDANPVYCAMLGYSVEELRTISFPRITPEKWQAWEGEEIWNKRLMKDGHTGIYEKEYVRKDGTIFPVELQAFTVFDTSRNIKYVWGTVRDITERKQQELALLKNSEELHASYEEITATEEELRANLDELVLQEQELRESKKELADIIEFLPDATFAINTEGKVIAWNHAMEVLSGIKKTDMINKGNSEYSLWLYEERRPILIDLVLGSDEGAARKYTALRKEGDKLIAEVFIPHLHDGKGAYLWFTASPLYDSRQKISGAIESIREITDQKERELALNQKNRELNAAYEELSATEEELRQRVQEIAGAQQALRDSETRYRNIVEDQTEFICRFLPGGIYIFVNDAYCRYFGVSREKILNHRFLSVIHADDREAVSRFFAGLTPEHPAGTIQHRIIMPDGNIRWQQWSDRAIFGPEGNVTEYQSVGRDITGQKEIENRLQKTSLEHQDLLENITDVYYRSDTEGRLILASRSWAVLLGYPDLAECIGRNIAETFYADPKERALFLEAVYRDGYVTDFEVTLKKKDGSCISVATSSYLYFDNAGHVLGVEGTFRDITERKRITEALRETKQQLTDIINFLPDATFAIDRQGNVIAWNHAIEEMTGVNAENIIGKGDHAYAFPFYGEQRPILIDFISTDARELQKNYSFIRKEGDVLTAETGMANLGGKNLILWGKASPLYNSRGEITGAIESIRDITERRILEDALKQVNKKLNLLSSITRHDILNKITICLGYLKIAKQKSHHPEMQKLIDILELNIGAIHSQIEFTRIYESLGATAPVWLDISELLSQSASAQNIPVTFTLPPLEVYADPLVGKVFYNLHDNTVRHGEHATRIQVTAQQRGNDLVIVWEDDGVGVPPDEKERIFERGFGKNTGLGLFLVREILSITGISIQENGEPGSGARFEIVIPPGSYRNIPACLPVPADTGTPGYYPEGGPGHAD